MQTQEHRSDASLWNNRNISDIKIEVAFKRESHCRQHAAAVHSSGPLVTTLHKLVIVIGLWILPWQSPNCNRPFLLDAHSEVQFVEQKTDWNNRAMQSGRVMDLPHWWQTSPCPSLSLPKSGIDWRSPLWETPENTDWHGAAVGGGVGQLLWIKTRPLSITTASVSDPFQNLS